MTLNLTSTVLQRETSGKIYGGVVGIVTNNQDPEEMGRVKVRFPWLSEEAESQWARLAVPMAGSGQGVCFIPEVDAEVLVMFEHGDIRFPYIIGSLWNGLDKPPETNIDGENNHRVIKSRSGHVIRFNDKEGETKIEIIDKTESNKIVFDAENNTIAISASADIKIESSDGKLILSGNGIDIISEDAINIKASGDVNVKGKNINLN